MKFDLHNISSGQDGIAIVTGANTGLGFETAKVLAGKDIKVVMACRNMEKAHKAKSNMLDKLPGAELETMQLDLARLDSVRSFAESFRKKYNKLDLLINNAGVMIPPYSKTEEGFELQFGVNYLAHFLLTSLLIDMMPDNSSSRVVTLSSKAHESAHIHFDDLQWEQSYSRQKAYGQSKLACLMFADELNRRLKAAGSHILSVSAHPGVSDTDLARHIPAVLYTLFKYTIVPFITHPPDEAALPTLVAALGQDVKGGEYYGPQGFKGMKGEPGLAERSTAAKDQEVAKRLWSVSEELTSCKFNPSAMSS